MIHPKDMEHAFADLERSQSHPSQTCVAKSTSGGIESFSAKRLRELIFLIPFDNGSLLIVYSMPNPNTQFDDETWRSFKNGDKTAFSVLYRFHVGALLNYGSKISSDRALIEDSIQDLFYELWNSRQRISDPTSVKSYLFKALRYKIHRNAKASDSSYSLDIGLLETLASPSHESQLIRFEAESLQMENLRSIIAQLPKRQQEAINLRYYHNFSNEEVAEIMGVNYQSAANFIFLALRKLKANLKVSVTVILFFLKFFPN